MTADSRSQMAAWQPIETAPKDGTHITVVNIYNAQCPSTTVHWFDDDIAGGWYLSVNQLAETSGYVWGPPTHWMPLPEAAAMTADSQNGAVVVEALSKACTNAGGQANWATINDLSFVYVSDVLRGKREPGPSILEALGFERIVTYRKKRR